MRCMVTSLDWIFLEIIAVFLKKDSGIKAGTIHYRTSDLALRDGPSGWIASLGNTEFRAQNVLLYLA